MGKMYESNAELSLELLKNVEKGRERISSGQKFNGTIYGKKIGTTKMVLMIYLSGIEFVLGEIERDQEKDARDIILRDLNAGKSSEPEYNMSDSLYQRRQFETKEPYLDYKITDLLSINLSNFVDTGNQFLQADIEQMQECAKNLSIVIHVNHTFKNGLTLQIATVESSYKKQILLLKKRTGEHKKILDVLPDHLEKLLTDVNSKIKAEL